MADDTGKKLPWKDGLYRFFMGGKSIGTVYIKGLRAVYNGYGQQSDEDEPAPIIELSVGEFETNDKRGLEKSGHDKYMIKIVLTFFENMTIHANVNKDGANWTTESGDALELLSEEDIKKMEEELDPADNYSHFYEIQPEKKSIVWLTGGMGMGKTTTAEVLRKEHNFVYYEGDAFVAM